VRFRDLKVQHTAKKILEIARENDDAEAIKVAEKILKMVRIANKINEQKIHNDIREEFWRHRLLQIMQDLLDDDGNILGATLAGFETDAKMSKAKRQLTELAHEIGKINNNYKRTLLFVDEAAMASMIEVLYLVVKMGADEATIVLLGDVLQLMPYGLGTFPKELDLYIDDDEFYKEFGVEKEALTADWVDDIISTSLLELRYGDYGTHSDTLLDNYRSTPAIVEVLEQMAYRENDIEMVSKNLDSKVPVNKQVMHLKTKNRDRDQLHKGIEGAYINENEIHKLIFQMDFDLKFNDDLNGSQITFITPYNSQRDLITRSIWATAMIGELKRLQENGGNFTEIPNLQLIISHIDQLIEDSGRPSVNFSALASVNGSGKMAPAKIASLLNQLDNSLPHFISRNMKNITIQRMQDFGSIDYESDLDATTIQKVQGRENRAVYISFVRNNKWGNLGFLFGKRGQGMLITAIGRATEMVRVATNARTWEVASEIEPDTYRNAHGVKTAKMMLKFFKFVDQLKAWDWDFLDQYEDQDEHLLLEAA